MTKFRFKESVVVLMLVVSALLLLPGCNTMGQKEELGTIVGAVAGGLLGNQIGGGRGQTAATVAGIFIGSMIGRDIGVSLDEVDRQMIQQTSYIAFEKMPSGVASTWSNPNTGNSGTVTPMRTYQTSNGYCREFQTTINVGRQVQNAYGTVCRQPDGSWKIMQK
jgi:surface antigen